MTEETQLQITDLNDEEVTKLLEDLDTSDLEDTSKFALRELIRSNKDDIYFKTELNMPQIESITKLRLISKIMQTQSKYFNSDEKARLKARNELDNISVEMTDLLMKLLVSKNRQGRQEFVRAWEGSSEKQEGQKLYKKFFGGTGG